MKHVFEFLDIDNYEENPTSITNIKVCNDQLFFETNENTQNEYKFDIIKYGVDLCFRIPRYQEPDPEYIDFFSADNNMFFQVYKNINLFVSVDPVKQDDEKNALGLHYINND